MDYNASLETASRALATAKEWHGDEGGKIEGLKNELLIRAATLDTPHYLDAASKSAAKTLESEEARVPKQIRQLISALSVAESIGALNGNAPVGGSRPLLWRAVALAYASGHLSDASQLLKSLILSYDTTLTQKDRLKLATNKLLIDQKLATAGNTNGADLMEDYVVLADTLEDFSLGTDRDPKKAADYLVEATKLSEDPLNRKNRLAMARIYYAQARRARDSKVMPAMVINLLDSARGNLRAIDMRDSSRFGEQAAAVALRKKVDELEQELKRSH